MTIGKHFSHKTRFGSFRKNRNPESGLKSFCSKSLGVSGKIVGAKWREFFRYPKRFFLCEKCCPTFANVKAQTTVGSDSEGVF